MYELEVRNQAEALEKQLRRGAFKDSLVGLLALARLDKYSLDDLMEPFSPVTTFLTMRTMSGCL